MNRRALLAVAVLALAEPAQGAPRPRATPAVALPGMTVEVKRAPGGVRSVRVAGKKARVVSRRPLRFVLPAVKPGRRPVILRGRRAVRLRIRVMAPFDGRFSARPDAGRAGRATIGGTGGTVSTTGRDGTVFVLEVPAGALEKDVAIALTPLRVIKGLPLSSVTGVRLAPGGLTFRDPAVLTITLPRVARRPLAAFHGKSTGRDARPAGVSSAARSVRIEIRHFSDAALGEIASLAALLSTLVTFTPEDTFELHVAAAYLDLWETLQPGGCVALPDICVPFKNRAAGRAQQFLNADCGLSAAVPEFADLDRIAALAALRDRFRPGPPVTECLRAIVTGLVNAAIAPARDDPIGRSALAHAQLTPAQIPAADLDSDPEGFGERTIVNAEWLWFLQGRAIQLGLTQLAAEASGVVSAGLLSMGQTQYARCELDGERLVAGSTLQLAGRLARAIDQLVADALDTWSEYCFARVAIAPAAVTLAPGEVMPFTAAVTFFELSPIADTLDRTVTWTSLGGTIDASGLYTAPAQTGEYVVRATSRANPNRSATAGVRVVEGGWTGRRFVVSLAAGTRTSETGDEGPVGDCGVFHAPDGSVSWDEERSCSESRPSGSAQNTSRLRVTHSGFTIDAFARSASDASWNGTAQPENPPETGESQAFGEAVYDLDFTLGEPTAYALSGNLDAAVAGQPNARGANAGVVIRNRTQPPAVHDFGLTDQTGSLPFAAEGTLAPGDYELVVGADTDARVGPPADGFGTVASASATAAGRLDLYP